MQTHPFPERRVSQVTWCTPSIWVCLSTACSYIYYFLRPHFVTQTARTVNISIAEYTHVPHIIPSTRKNLLRSVRSEHECRQHMCSCSKQLFLFQYSLICGLFSQSIISVDVFWINKNGSYLSSRLLIDYHCRQEFRHWFASMLVGNQSRHEIAISFILYPSPYFFICIVLLDGFSCVVKLCKVLLDGRD